MNARIYMILGATLATLLASAQTKVWTLQQCVDTAVARNRTIKQQVLETRNRDIAYDQARKNLLPSVDANASQNLGLGRTLGENNTYQSGNGTSVTTSTSLGISSSVLLYNGNRLQYEIKAKRADAEASKADLEKTKKNIATNVAAGYLQVLLNKELLRVAEEQLSLTKAKVEQRKSLVQSGKMAEGELLELYAQQAKEELTRTQAQNTLNLSLLDLAQYMEVDDFQSLDVVSPSEFAEKDFVLLAAEDVYSSAIVNRPEIKAAEARLKSSEYSLNIARTGYYPSVSLSGSVGSSYYINNVKNPLTGQAYDYDSFGKQIGDKVNGGFSLNVSVPIFDKYATRNNIKSAKLGIESKQIAIDDARKELRKTIQQAYYNAVGASSRWESAKQSVAANKEAYRFSNQKYEAGRATLYELYQAKNNLTQAESEQIQAKYEYFFRVKLLELLK